MINLRKKIPESESFINKMGASVRHAIGDWQKQGESILPFATMMIGIWRPAGGQLSAGKEE